MVAPIALQLYTVRDALAADLEGTLKRVADIGFVGVEPWNGIDPQQTKSLLDKLGLQVFSLHAPPAVGDAADDVFRMIDIYELDNVVIPFLPPEKFITHEGIAEMIAIVNEAYENVSAKGIKMGYHNHDFEFVTLADGTLAYDAFLAQLHPDIFIELDTYWANLSGQDVPALLKKIQRPVPYLHIKDGPGEERNAPQVAAGDGIMDIPAIINSHDADWLVVELDSCATDMLEAVEKSYQYLTSNGLSRGKK
ncbi:MAG: sugar phosphate isomerase/epimerase family protein [Aggregatilineales bacterium]